MKNLGIISILIGIYTNDTLFIHLFSSFSSIIVLFIIGSIGFI
ncbi:hypothetical protein IGJ48_002487 [Enterococcus pernyi]